MVEQRTSNGQFTDGNTEGWQHGQSGNPKGRIPNKASITYQIKQLLAAGEGVKARELAETAIREAGKGSYPHFKEILDRTDGKLGDISLIQDNRVVNLIVTKEVGKLMPGVVDRLESVSELQEGEFEEIDEV